MRWAPLAIVVAVIGPAVAGSAPVFDHRDGVVFPADKAHELLRPCSRNAPQGVTGRWEPNEIQVRELEVRLPQTFVRALRGQAGRFRPMPEPLPTYDRQYAGIVVGGRKLIYINAFPHKMIDFDGTDIAQDWKKGTTWRHAAVTICDGGPGFWGAVYDPEQKTFTDFQFNGVL